MPMKRAYAEPPYLELADGQRPACLYTAEIRAHEQRARTLFEAARDCEQADKASRSLDACIEVAIGAAVARDGAGRAKSADGKRYRVIAYTASLDAATTLVPEGHKWQVGQSDSGEPNRQWFAELRRGHMTSYDKAFPCYAATPALALCAAALRARAA